MRAKAFGYYAGGTVLWVLLLSAIPATQTDTNALITNYFTLTFGLVVGSFCKRFFEKRPWVLLFVPVLPLTVGFFGWL